MQEDFKTRKLSGVEEKIYWPRERGRDTNWWHSDMKAISYLFVYPLFDELVFRGGVRP